MDLSWGQAQIRTQVWLLRQGDQRQILPSSEGRSDDMVMLRLLEAHCLPILTYAIEVVHVKDRDYRRKLRVAYNSVYRKMFGYSYRESVTELQHCLNRPTWEELLDKRKAAFLQKFPKLPAGSLVRALSSYAYVLVC